MHIENYKNWKLLFEDAGDDSGSIKDKSVSNYKDDSHLNQPSTGPIGDISKSATANIDVPTRGISGTDNGNLGCAAAVSIIFYRATGLPIIKGRNKYPIELGTASLWKQLTDTNKHDWIMISDWKNKHKPGDIILTSRGKKAGHVGVVVDGGRIISNSSGGFKGDARGQIEMNYSISSWDSVAQRNSQQTALFRYIGPYADKWGDIPPSNKGFGSNDSDQIKMDIELPEIVIQGVNKSKLDTIRIDAVKPSQLIDNNGLLDIVKSGNQPDKK
jgi:hypothetical protein